MRRSSCSMSTVPVPAVSADSTRAQSSLLVSPAMLPPPRKPISNLTLVSPSRLRHIVACTSSLSTPPSDSWCTNATARRCRRAAARRSASRPPPAGARARRAGRPRRTRDGACPRPAGPGSGPTGVSSPSGASSSTRPLSPSSIASASTPWSSTRSLASSVPRRAARSARGPRSRSRTAMPTWWMPSADTPGSCHVPRPKAAAVQSCRRCTTNGRTRWVCSTRSRRRRPMPWSGQGSRSHATAEAPPAQARGRGRGRQRRARRGRVRPSGGRHARDGRRTRRACGTRPRRRAAVEAKRAEITKPAATTTMTASKRSAPTARHGQT